MGQKPLNNLAPPGNGLALTDRYGQFQIGGPLRGNAGFLDRAFDVIPGVGDYRGAQRLMQAAKPTMTPNLMGGVNVGMTDPSTVTGEALAISPMIGDAMAVAKAGAATFGPLIAMMAKRNAELTGLARMGRNQAGIIGYHGSPHRFDRFDHSQMGTGEGAQAYGWGTYLAETDDVARQYANDLAYGIEIPGVDPAVNRQMARDFAGSDYISIDEIPDEWFQEIADDFRLGGMEDAARSLELADKSKARPVTGNLYEVDLPDEKIAQMLDWDAPLSEQPESVRKAFGYGINDKFMRGEISQDEVEAIRTPLMGKWTNEKQTGGEMLDSLRYSLDPHGTTENAAELFLKENGIPGIKFWDGNSRTAGKGTRNFVVFDENDMTVLKRNNEEIAQSLPMDEASRMTRANVDYPIEAYHGTNKDIKSFDPSKRGGATRAKSAQKAFWFTDDAPTTASGYADLAGDNEVQKLIDASQAAERRGDWDAAHNFMVQAEELDQVIGKGENVMPIRLGGKMKTVDMGGAKYDPNDMNLSKILDEAKAEGFEGVKFTNFSDEAGYGVYNPVTHYAVFDPKNIRSKFAKFDPAKKNSANLLAGGAAAAVGVNALADRDSRQ